MPVSLQFSNAPVERNVNGRSASSAHYLNGRPASQAEVIRARQQQEQLEQQRQGAGGFNWKSQPVGGRPGSALCADAAPVNPTAAANGSEHMFGAIGSPGANGFPGLVQPETTGKRILGGTIPAASLVHDLQTTLPQKLQCCLPRNALNFLTQQPHAFVELRG